MRSVLFRSAASSRSTVLRVSPSSTKAGAQLVSGDELLGGHLLVAGALAVRLSDLARPHLRLTHRVAAHRLLPHEVYVVLQIGPQALGVFDVGENPLPNQPLQRLCPRPEGVGASLRAVPVAVGAGIVIVGVAASLLRFRAVGGAHGLPTLAAVGYLARKLPEPPSGAGGLAVALDHGPRRFHLLAEDARVGDGYGLPLFPGFATPAVGFPVPAPVRTGLGDPPDLYPAPVEPP